MVIICYVTTRCKKLIFWKIRDVTPAPYGHRKLPTVQPMQTAVSAIKLLSTLEIIINSCMNNDQAIPNYFKNQHVQWTFKSPKKEFF